MVRVHRVVRKIAIRICILWFYFARYGLVSIYTLVALSDIWLRQTKALEINDFSPVTLDITLIVKLKNFFSDHGKVVEQALQLDCR